MLCLLLTVVCTRAAAVQEASCATSCGFSWRLLLSWAWAVIIPDGLVQQAARRSRSLGGPGYTAYTRLREIQMR
jgi:hypothetical protein